MKIVPKEAGAFMKEKTIRVALLGNPNCGKTTLVNAITGAKIKTGNWPGVTIEKKEAEFISRGKQVIFTDLPGIYSLDASRAEEKVAADYLKKEPPDIILNIVDAGHLEKSLYLTLQLMEQEIPMILVLNRIDIMPEIKQKVLSEKLENLFVLTVSATKKIGLDELLLAITQGKIPVAQTDFLKQMPYISKRYEYIEKITKQATENQKVKQERTDKLDQILTHPIFGVPVFFGIMALVFFLTFRLGNELSDVWEIIWNGISEIILHKLYKWQVQYWLISFISDGVLTGIGSVLAFLPNLCILFFALAILEDSGYMARVAYVMDGMLGHSLSGKACIPMILGFGCSVPAVMAVRTLESEEERKRVMMLIPFLSCSAKLPVYVLFSRMFFGKYAMYVSYSFYLLGIFFAICLACLMEQRREETRNELVMELPEYSLPRAENVFRYVLEKAGSYLKKAGTLILLASMVLWFFMNFNEQGMVEKNMSFAARAGKNLAIIFRPAGFGIWQMVVALIFGLLAKEMIVSSLALLYGSGSLFTSWNRELLKQQLQMQGFGMVSAYTFLVFCLLYVPCIATIATIYKESGSFWFTAKVVIGQLFFAWFAATFIYMIGTGF